MNTPKPDYSKTDHQELNGLTIGTRVVYSEGHVNNLAEGEIIRLYSDCWGEFATVDMISEDGSTWELDIPANSFNPRPGRRFRTLRQATQESRAHMESCLSSMVRLNQGTQEQMDKVLADFDKENQDN